MFMYVLSKNPNIGLFMGFIGQNINKEQSSWIPSVRPSGRFNQLYEIEAVTQIIEII